MSYHALVCLKQPFDIVDYDDIIDHVTLGRKNFNITKERVSDTLEFIRQRIKDHYPKSNFEVTLGTSTIKTRSETSSYGPNYGDTVNVTNITILFNFKLLFENNKEYNRFKINYQDDYNRIFGNLRPVKLAVKSVDYIRDHE